MGCLPNSGSSHQRVILRSSAKPIVNRLNSEASSYENEEPLVRTDRGCQRRAGNQHGRAMAWRHRRQSGNKGQTSLRPGQKRRAGTRPDLQLRGSRTRRPWTASFAAAPPRDAFEAYDECPALGMALPLPTRRAEGRVPPTTDHAPFPEPSPPMVARSPKPRPSPKRVPARPRVDAPNRRGAIGSRNPAPHADSNQAATGGVKTP